MYFKNIELHQYRNISDTLLTLSPRLNIFIGDNGQGKTNILESIHLLIEGDSFRYGDYSNLIQFGYSQAYVKANLMNNQLDYSLLMRLINNKKELLVNQKKISKSQQLFPPIILFSPESLSIIKESSDERRKLVDHLIITTKKNGKTIIDEFKKILKMRNKLLKDINEEKINRSLGIETLESINKIFFILAAKLTYQRIESLLEIKPYVEKALSQIEQKEIKFSFEYQISSQIENKYQEKNVENSEENFFNIFKKRAEELLVAEITSGISLVGPQKHDVKFLYNGNDSRFYCSQGQQRSIILAFKISQIVYHHMVNGYYPILLLDDVLSELDNKKQNSLVNTLNEIQTQVFITSTDIEAINKLSRDNNSLYKVENGNFTLS